jgi:hypothetical protein
MAAGEPKAIAFVVAMVLGMALYEWVDRAPTTASAGA